MIRNATSADIAGMARIYNEAVIEGGFTGDLMPLSLENRTAWFRDHEDRYAIFVKETNSVLIGYVALSPYRKGRQAFSGTVEISYYLASQHRGQGIGKQLLAHAIEYAAGAEFHLIVAILLGCNHRSIGLLEKYGFSECGRLPVAANINGVSIDHIYLARTLASNSTSANQDEQRFEQHAATFPPLSDWRQI